MSVPDAAAILGEGWSRAGHGVLGELTIGGLVGAAAPKSQDQAAMTSAAGWTNAAASGWGGDRFELWTSKGPGAVVLLQTRWDTPTDAEEFERAVAAASPKLRARR